MKAIMVYILDSCMALHKFNWIIIKFSRNARFFKYHAKDRTENLNLILMRLTFVLVIHSISINRGHLVGKNKKSIGGIELISIRTKESMIFQTS